MTVAKILHNGEMFIRGTRRCVHYEVVQTTPVYISEELLDQTCEGRGSVSMYTLRWILVKIVDYDSNGVKTCAVWQPHKFRKRL